MDDQDKKAIQEGFKQEFMKVDFRGIVKEVMEDLKKRPGQPTIAGMTLDELDKRIKEKSSTWQ